MKIINMEDKMRILVAEDDSVSRKFMHEFLSNYGECDVTKDGIEAIEAFIMALDLDKPYDLVCLDVMMPKVDGIKVLKAIRDLENIREIESENRVKIIVTTALANIDFINSSLQTGLEAYMEKPIDLDAFEDIMKKMKLL